MILTTNESKQMKTKMGYISRIYLKIQHVSSLDTMSMKKEKAKKKNMKNGLNFKNFPKKSTFPIPGHDINDKRGGRKGKMA